MSLCRLSTAVFLMFFMASIGYAQHHHHQHQHYPSYHGSHWGHSNWNYVVPSYGHYGQHYHGTYYVQNGGYYYTPTSVAQPVAYQSTVTAGYPGTVTTPPPQTIQQPVQMQYGSFAQCSDLAGRLENEANNLCLDLHYNYQANAGFAELYREAYQVYQEAKQIHASEHQGNREDIRRRVAGLDEQFHHIQGEMATLTRQPYRQIAEGGIQQKSSSMEAILHHLAFSVGVQPHSAQQQEIAPPPGGNVLQTAPPPS